MVLNTRNTLAALPVQPALWIPPDLNKKSSPESWLQLWLAPRPTSPVTAGESGGRLQLPFPPLAPPSGSPALLPAILRISLLLPRGPAAKALYCIFNAVCNCSAHSTCREQMMLQRLACWDLAAQRECRSKQVSFIRADSQRLPRLKMKDLFMSDVCFYLFG